MHHWSVGIALAERADAERQIVLEKVRLDAR
jgi:hypothetical protein